MPPCTGCNSPLCPDCNPSRGNKPLVLIATLAIAAVMTLSACGYKDPCRTLPPPSPAELAVARSGAEIERDVNGVECDLENGRWVRDTDSSKHTVRKTTTKTSVPTTRKTVTTKPTAVKR